MPLSLILNYLLKYSSPRHDFKEKNCEFLFIHKLWEQTFSQQPSPISTCTHRSQDLGVISWPIVL